MKTLSNILCLFLILSGVSKSFGQGNKVLKNGDILLTGWQLKSTVLEKASGEDISMGLHSRNNWCKAEVPTTVLNALVKDGVYPDPRLNMNNFLVPDISNRFNAKFGLAKYSFLPNHVNPWKKPYWFLTTFAIPDSDRGKQVWLHFNGINYRGAVWLNGKEIADSSQMVGMFLRYKYNVTEAIRNDGTNRLAVKIFPVDHPGVPGTQLKVFGPPRAHDVTMFKDETLKISGGWDCALPVRDRNMGIYRRVYVSFSRQVVVIHPYVVTTLPLPDTSVANLKISATLSNVSNEKQTATLMGRITLLTDVNMGSYVKHYPGKMEPITFQKEVEVPANGEVKVLFSYEDIPQLTIHNPHLWWPNTYGQQYLHNLRLTCTVNGEMSDSRNTMFGIREVTSKLKELDGHYGRIFYVNGKKIFCKGGWLQPDMLLDNSRRNVYDQARLIADANLDLVSSEDMPAPSKEFMDALDKYGLMWWEVFYQSWVLVPGTKTAYDPYDHYLAIESTRDIILRNRNHPSLVAWCSANETLPGPDLYLALRSQLKALDTTRVFLVSTAIWWNWKKLTPYIKSDLPVGTTDNGPPDYTWYPLPYYFNKIDAVKQQMFHNEEGMDAVPPLSSLKKFIFNLGKDTNTRYYPLDSVWAEHGAWDLDGYAFRAYYNAIKHIYGFHTKSVADFARIAQLVNADNYRAMYEAANSRMWDITSGLMIWKLNASYPDFAWEIYDWFLNPNAGYYYVKRACQPLHIQLNANDLEVSVINTRFIRFDSLTVRATMYDFNMKLRWQREMEIDIGANRYEDVFSVPRLARVTPIYFVRLQLLSPNGKELSNNLYWESSQNPRGFFNISHLQEVKKAEAYWDSIPLKAAPFSRLSKLEDLKLNISYKVKEVGPEYWLYVKVKNPTRNLSIMNRLAVVKKDDKQEILPTYWSNNFIWLFPGEEKRLVAKFEKGNLKPSSFTVTVNGKE